MGYSTAMDGSTLFFIIFPIVIPICLGLLIALPVLADRNQARGIRRQRASKRQSQSADSEDARRDVKRAGRRRPSGARNGCIRRRRPGPGRPGPGRRQARSGGDFW